MGINDAFVWAVIRRVGCYSDTTHYLLGVFDGEAAAMQVIAEDRAGVERARSHIEQAGMMQGYIDDDAMRRKIDKALGTHTRFGQSLWDVDWHAGAVQIGVLKAFDISDMPTSETFPILNGGT